MPGAGKPFKKGNRASVGKGRPEVPPELKAARKLTRPQVEAVFNKYLYCTLVDLEKTLVDAETHFLDRIVISIGMRAFKEGDQAALGFFLDRLVGKVKDKIEVTVPTPFVIRRPSGETLELGMEKPKEIEE